MASKVCLTSNVMLLIILVIRNARNKDYFQKGYAQVKQTEFENVEKRKFNEKADAIIQKRK